MEKTMHKRPLNVFSPISPCSVSCTFPHSKSNKAMKMKRNEEMCYILKVYHSSTVYQKHIDLEKSLVQAHLQAQSTFIGVTKLKPDSCCPGCNYFAII